MRLIELFVTFLKIGMFSIGGGYAIIPFIQSEIVNQNNWLSITEFTDIITISQMTPGPLAVNTASFVGLRIEGILGAVLATIGVTTAGVLISNGLYRFFARHKSNKSINTVLQGLKASSTGLIAASSSTILLIALFNEQSLPINIQNINIFALLIFLVSLLLLRKYKLSPMTIIILSGIIGIFIY